MQNVEKKVVLERRENKIILVRESKKGFILEKIEFTVSDYWWKKLYRISYENGDMK